MRKFTFLLALSVFLLTVNGESRPGKLAGGGRLLSTQGKTLHQGSPHTGLMLGEDASGFSEITSDPVLPGVSNRRASEIISASGTDLQGYLKASSSIEYHPGWYDVNTNGEVSLLFSNTAMMGSCGFVRDGRICQFTAINSYGYYWFYYTEYSLETGEQLYEIELPDSDMRNYVVNCAYNEKEDLVYMQTYSKNFSSLAWSTFDPRTHERVYLNNGLSWEDNRVISIAVNPRDNRIYGIKDNGEYVEIDRLTGNTTKITTLSVSPAEYSQSMVYAPIERGFVWAAMLTDNTSGFYRIEPATGEVSLLGKMPAQNQFLMLWTPDKDASDTAPGMPEFTTAFEGPSLTGTAQVSMPDDTFGGEALDPASVIVAEINADGSVLATVEGKPGAQVSTALTMTQGEHDVTVRCRLKSSDQWGPEKKSRFYTGYDNPSSPSQVRIKEGRISWKAPTSSVHGGYVDFSKLRYTVTLNDIPVTSSPVSATSVAFEAPSSLGIYQARVSAEADGMKSEPGVSEGVRFGEYLQFPFSFTPTSKEFGLFTVIDGNNDGNKWKYFEGKDCVYYNTGSSNGADEWLLFPKAEFMDGEHLIALRLRPSHC